jgi:diacylglycerol kinase (ATP)
MKPGKTGLSRLIDATGYSFKGFKAAFKHEAAFRQEVFLALILIPTAFWFAESGLQLALLLGSLLLVLMVEIINSAIEAVVDRLGHELHELSGRAKDLGSAAVFLALINALVIWLAILFY